MTTSTFRLFLWKCVERRTSQGRLKHIPYPRPCNSSTPTQPACRTEITLPMTCGRLSKSRPSRNLATKGGFGGRCHMAGALCLVASPFPGCVWSQGLNSNINVLARVTNSELGCGLQVIPSSNYVLRIASGAPESLFCRINKRVQPHSPNDNSCPSAAQAFGGARLHAYHCLELGWIAMLLSVLPLRDVWVDGGIFSGSKNQMVVVSNALETEYEG
jgi:hypothetical protein